MNRKIFLIALFVMILTGLSPVSAAGISYNTDDAMDDLHSWENDDGSYTISLKKADKKGTKLKLNRKDIENRFGNQYIITLWNSEDGYKGKQKFTINKKWIIVYISHFSTNNITISGTGFVYVIDGKTQESNYSDIDHKILEFTMDNINGSELINDVDPTKNNATMNGTVIAPGKYGNALKFDGKDDKVVISDYINSEEITISIWVNSHNRTSANFDQIFLMKENSYYVNLMELDGTSKFYIINSTGNTHAIQSISSISVDTWNYMSYVYGSGQFKIYKNGVLDNSVAYQGPIKSDNTPIVLGNYYASGDDRWAVNASIDDFKIYNRALTADQIKAIYDKLIYSHPLKSDNISAMEGLVAYYTLDEDSGTIAYNNKDNTTNNGTITGASWTNGRYGKALSFDGVDDGVNLTNIDTSWDAITVLAWIKTNTVNTNQGIISKDQSGFTRIWKLIISGDKINGAVKTTVGEIGVTGSTVVTDNLWHLVGFVYDGSNIQIAIDGKFEVSAAQTGDILSGDDSVYLGNYYATSNSYKGIIDEPMIFNRALSIQEIQDLYYYRASADVKIYNENTTAFFMPVENFTETSINLHIDGMKANASFRVLENGVLKQIKTADTTGSLLFNDFIHSSSFWTVTLENDQELNDNYLVAGTQKDKFYVKPGQLFRIKSVGWGNVNNWTWNLNTSNKSDVSDFYISFNQGGEYSCSLTVSNTSNYSTTYLPIYNFAVIVGSGVVQPPASGSGILSALPLLNDTVGIVEAIAGIILALLIIIVAYAVVSFVRGTFNKTAGEMKVK